MKPAYVTCSGETGNKSERQVTDFTFSTYQQCGVFMVSDNYLDQYFQFIFIKNIAWLNTSKGYTVGHVDTSNNHVKSAACHSDLFPVLPEQVT